MQGREIINRFSVLIAIGSLIIKVLPRALRVFLWDLLLPFSQIPFIGLRYIILKSLIANCGKNVRIGDNVRILGWTKLTIGNNVSIHSSCYIDSAGGIQIGDNVSIAHHSTLLSSSHTWLDANIPIKNNNIVFHQVIVEDDVWIGCACRIISCRRIGNRAIVGAGSIVLGDIPPNTISVGIPAKVIKLLV